MSHARMAFERLMDPTHSYTTPAEERADRALIRHALDRFGVPEAVEQRPEPAIDAIVEEIRLEAGRCGWESYTDMVALRRVLSRHLPGAAAGQPDDWSKFEPTWEAYRWPSVEMSHWPQDDSWAVRLKGFPAVMAAADTRAVAFAMMLEAATDALIAYSGWLAEAEAKVRAPSASASMEEPGGVPANEPKHGGKAFAGDCPVPIPDDLTDRFWRDVSGAKHASRTPGGPENPYRNLTSIEAMVYWWETVVRPGLVPIGEPEAWLVERDGKRWELCDREDRARSEAGFWDERLSIDGKFYHTAHAVPLCRLPHSEEPEKK